MVVENSVESVKNPRPLCPVFHIRRQTSCRVYRGLNRLCTVFAIKRSRALTTTFYPNRMMRAKNAPFLKNFCAVRFYTAKEAKSMSWLDKLERRYGRFYISNLMLWVVGGQLVVWLLVMLVDFRVYPMLTLSRWELLHGQVWRLVSFIFLPPLSANPLLVALSLYFDYIIGVSLERQWGGFCFNVFFLAGMLGSIAAALLVGSADNSALGLSLFFAFAMLFPEAQVLLFYVLPVKVKWLGWIAAGLYLWQLLTASLTGKASLLLGMAGFLLFFGRSLFDQARRSIVNYRRRQQWKNQWKK